MTGASIVSALGAAWILGAPAAAIVIGMFGPLAAASGSWVVAERTFRRQPERLTSVMAGAFGAKLVFFGAYVAVALRALAVPPVPFVVSFTSYFIALYLTEALLLRHLFATEPSRSRGR
jgi:hypothetical protein